MRTNVSRPDRVVRFVIGAGILGLFGALSEPWRYLTLAGLIPFGYESHRTLSDVRGDRVESTRAS